MGRLPFDQIDVLVVGELGKNYSGAGMDPNVIGRLMVETHARLRPAGRHPPRRARRLGGDPRQHRRRRLRRPDDRSAGRVGSTPRPFRINVLTSCCLERARIPITLPTDRDVFDAAAGDLLADRPGRGPHRGDPQHARAEHDVGLAAPWRPRSPPIAT